MVYACNGFFAILWNFQLQHSGILTCNFRYFYLTTNSWTDDRRESWAEYQIGNKHAIGNKGRWLKDEKNK
jgi:hypothetical protein